MAFQVEDPPIISSLRQGFTFISTSAKESSRGQMDFTLASSSSSLDELTLKRIMNSAGMPV